MATVGAWVIVLIINGVSYAGHSLYLSEDDCQKAAAVAVGIKHNCVPLYTDEQRPDFECDELVGPCEFGRDLMERNPLASLMMGLRGGGGSTEGARAYPGGYKGEPIPGSTGVFGTNWAPDEVALVKKHFGVSDAKWKNLDHTTQFGLLMEAQDAQAKSPYISEGHPQYDYKLQKWIMPNDPELEKAIEDLTKPYANPPAKNVPEYLPGQPTVRAYHGTQTGPVAPAYSPEERAAMEQVSPSRFYSPEPHRTEQGVFFTPDPETASRYAGYVKSPGGASYPGAKVFPVDLDMKNSVTVDLRKIPGITDYQRMYDPKYVQTAIEQAKQQNKDFVVIKGMNDVGGNADQIIALKPAGKVKSALTGEALYAHPLSALLAAALAGGTVSRRQRADETTISPENIGRP